MAMKINKWLLPIVFVILLMLTMTGTVNVVFWDKFFLFGLLCFMIGGVFWLIENNVFKNTINSFRLFFKKSSKIENYVSELEEERVTNDIAPLKSSIGTKLLLFGLFILITSTVSSYFFYY
ncbi:DUF3899 domain-containing protein [Lentibacillus cibarius]|uniref:DUF3899 domain-containing protein n=1 Tax=Lentibacillus cibarius TaxID=2583219 RepID=A0A549YEM4_9BACI|nr:DUF3899 domain-containing protein [Lentibacillus cibarius]TRM10322.1 DUF3899 domain-containing protein [Lentibacillus cibarius]